MSDNIFGPVLPDHLKKDDSKKNTVDVVGCYGPILPPTINNKYVPHSAGLVFPNSDKTNTIIDGKNDDLTEKQNHSDHDSYGPQLPLHLNVQECKYESEDDDIIGPILPGSSVNTSTMKALDERAALLRYGFMNEDSASSKVQKRESWMIELPPEKASNIGLGPRKFKNRYGNGDKKHRAGWTETPTDKNKESEPSTLDPDEDMFEDALIAKRNKEIDEIVKKSKKSKKHKKSLLDIHRDKLKKKHKKEKKDKKSERKPFDRETDLQINRFDEAQKKSIIKKAQLLNTRFTAGKSKYL